MCKERCKEMFNKNILENGLILSDVYDIVTEDITQPDFPQGEALLKIVKCEASEVFGQSKNIRVRFICEDNSGIPLVQIFIIKNGIANNLCKFICEALGYEPEGEFNIKQLEGKKIKATIAHNYSDYGLSYANIVFCEPAQ
jgi:hypothetical protein